VNGYVAGGWGVTAVVMALYAWRLVHRGRVLTRSLPDRPLPDRPLPAAPVTTGPAGSSTPAPLDGTPGGRSWR
jgi:hypothetical protein